MRRKIESGYLPVLADGKLDPALVGTAWRKRNGPAADSADSKGADRDQLSALVSAPALELPDTIEDEAERLVFESGRVFATEAEAKRHKESYLALLRELEYDREIGAVVLVGDVVTAVTGEYALVRNRLLNIASRVAPRAAVLRSAEEVKALIDAEVALVLEELRLDGHGGADPADLQQSIRERFGPSS
ncbi:hypothetical protein [Faunimonas pinastri]|uniref:hypothetical protein n=1 Tax=Faunimonas pinastri TaxID=1855383 RepID=UPI00115F92C8|nr:hypothetical protein [Faunimonas pinastri]